MKKTSIASFACMLIYLPLLLISCTNDAPVQQVKESPATELSQAELITRGKYLVTVIGCNHCHTPKKMGPQGPVFDSSLLLSGHHGNSPLPAIDTKALTPGYWVLFAGDLTATVGPWGISYAANLTPDSLTGIGLWSEETFVKTLRSGKHLGQEGGRPIMPPMPWDNFNHLPDEDIKSIFAYLKTIPPVSNRVHQPYSPVEVRQMATANKTAMK